MGASPSFSVDMDQPMPGGLEGADTSQSPPSVAESYMPPRNSENLGSSLPPPSNLNKPLASQRDDLHPAPGRKPKVEDLGFCEFSSGTNPVVDIVAIHGLDGHREETWMTGDGTLWLRNFLSTDLPNARVLSYGYDANTGDQECISTQTMRRHADGFANALARKRREAPRRPIIFIAHNLGGIILKWALVICHNQRVTSKCNLRNILVSTHAILFFGTPHSGVEDNMLEAIKRVASVYMYTTDVILRDLRANSSELENVQSLYLEASDKINTMFFYEEYATEGQREPFVPYHSATIAGDREANSIVLHANHHDLVRFGSKENVNYETVIDYLTEYVQSASAQVGPKWVTEDRFRSAAMGQSNPEQDLPPRYVEKATT